MNEPTLNQISDYHTLKGQKKRVVRAVILSGLIIGSIYAIVANSYMGQAHDRLQVNDGITAVPFNR